MKGKKVRTIKLFGDTPYGYYFLKTNNELVIFEPGKVSRYNECFQAWETLKLNKVDTGELMKILYGFSWKLGEL